MAKDVKDLAKTGVSMAKVGIGCIPVVLGGAVFGAIGAGIGTFVGEKYLTKGTEDKKMVKVLGYATSVDMAFESLAGGRGLLG